MGDIPHDDPAKREGAPTAGTTGAGGDPGTATPQGTAEPAQRTPHDVIVALQAEAQGSSCEKMAGMSGMADHHAMSGAGMDPGMAGMKGHEGMENCPCCQTGAATPAKP